MDRIRSSTQTLLRQMATCSLFKLLKRAKVWKEQRNCHLFALGCQLGLHDLWSSMPLLIVIGSQEGKEVLQEVLLGVSSGFTTFIL